MEDLVITRVISNSIKGESKCHLCDSSYDLENCHLPNKKTLSEKSKFLYDKRYDIVAYFLFYKIMTHSIVKPNENTISARKAHYLFPWV